jgi:hypothetical protein
MANAIADDETGTLISADKVEGTSVYNRSGDKLGSVKTVMIDKKSGKVAYAVMSFGGFLGIGSDLHPLPWAVLDYDTAEDGYVVDLDKDTLEKAPRMAADRQVDWHDQTWGREVHDYYRATPYWM